MVDTSAGEATADLVWDPTWRAAAEELTTELRQLVEVHNTTVPSVERLREALQLARDARAQLVGASRPRWYESDDPKRPAYADTGPVRGVLNPLAPPLQIRVVDRDPRRTRVQARALLGLSYEAPRLGVHGGWVAALLDDVLSSVQGINPVPGYTVSLTVQLHAMTPVNEELALEAWLDRDEGRRLYIKATCHAGDLLTAEAEALFIKSDIHRRTGEEG